MRRLYIAMAGLVLACTSTVPALATIDPAECSEQCLKDLAAARAATEKYRDVGRAVSDGYVPTGECAEGASGAMGIHYANALVEPGMPDLTRPDLLLYMPDLDGGQRLVALEYLVPVKVDGIEYFGLEPPPANAQPDAAPVLFDHEFDGPMPGHVPVQGWHYDLHVWAWSDNPRGTFAQFNPLESCSPLAPQPRGRDPILLDNCHELYVEVPAPYENARAVVPAHYEPITDLDGRALVALRASRCDVTIAGRATPTLMGQVGVLLEAPQDSSSHFVAGRMCCDWYSLAIGSDNPQLNAWLTQDTGLGPTVRDLTSVVYSYFPERNGGLDPATSVRIEWPGHGWSFSVDAVAFEPRSEAAGPPLIVNLWHDTALGRVRLEGASRLRTGPASGTVTLVPGSALALLLATTSASFASPIASNRLDGATLTKSVGRES